MNKTILLLAHFIGLLPISIWGQNKYNDLVKNHLFGPVKEVTMTRQVYGEDEGYDNAKRTTAFDTQGYITSSEQDKYKYNETYTGCKCDIYPGGTTQEQYILDVKEKNHECVYSGKYVQRFDNGGEWLTTNGEFQGIIFKFDTSHRISTITRNDYMGSSLFSLLNDHCANKTFYYQGNEKLPYKETEEIDRGGDEWNYSLKIKYTKFDEKRNWTHRKLYLANNNKLLMEETRTITYYPETNIPATTSSQPTKGKNKVPQYVGGQIAMKKFFIQNANPRKPAIATAGYGEIVIEFTVTETGSIENAMWKARVSESLDKEAIRLVKMMPKWNPGLINGKPTRMNVQVGIRFFPQQEFRYIKTLL